MRGRAIGVTRITDHVDTVSSPQVAFAEAAEFRCSSCRMGIRLPSSILCLFVADRSWRRVCREEECESPAVPRL